jgi:hypothetical protein
MIPKVVILVEPANLVPAIGITAGVVAPLFIYKVLPSQPNSYGNKSLFPGSYPPCLICILLAI